MKQKIRARTLAAIFTLVSFLGAADAMPGPGDAPPSDLGRNAAGDEVLLSAYAGKAVVVTFWASWCPQCIKELPILEAVQNQVGKDRLVVIAINTERPEVFRKAVRLLRETVHLELVSDAGGAAQKAYGVNGIPHMVIIDRDGRIMQVHRGYSEDDLGDIVADINRVLSPAP